MTPRDATDGGVQLVFCARCGDEVEIVMAAPGSPLVECPECDDEIVAMDGPSGQGRRR